MSCSALVFRYQTRLLADPSLLEISPDFYFILVRSVTSGSQTGLDDDTARDLCRVHP